MASTWPGPAIAEARAAYERARTTGLSAARSLVVACIASFRDGWMFRRGLAEHTGLSVRTVQRAITQAKEEGLIGVARARTTEIPPGLQRPLPCGWSHRWTIGWGQAFEAAKDAVARTKVARVIKAAARAVAAPIVRKTQQSPRPPRKWTAEELDAELARIELARVETVQAPPD